MAQHGIVLGWDSSNPAGVDRRTGLALSGVDDKGVGRAAELVGQTVPAVRTFRLQQPTAPTAMWSLPP